MPDPLTVLPLAHASHWLVWVLYLAPVLAVLGAIVFGTVRARRFDEQERARAEAEAGEGGRDRAGGSSDARAAAP